MNLIGQSPPLASYLCLLIFVSLLVFIVWGIYYSAKQRGADALGALCQLGGAFFGFVVAIGLMFVLGIGGGLVGMVGGAVGGAFGAKGGEAIANSLRAQRSVKRKRKKRSTAPESGTWDGTGT